MNPLCSSASRKLFPETKEEPVASERLKIPRRKFNVFGAIKCPIHASLTLVGTIEEKALGDTPEAFSLEGEGGGAPTPWTLPLWSLMGAQEGVSK